MLTVYVDEISPRIEYVLDFIFSKRGVDFKITMNRSDVENATHRLYYSTSEFPDKWIPSAKIISEKVVIPQAIELAEFGNEACFSFDGVADPIASIFYHLTRYEEYHIESKDAHGRFPLSSSKAPIAWLEQVKCDRWAEEVIKFCGLIPSYPEKPAMIPTFDIDNSYAYKLKTGKRKLLSIIKDVSKADISRIKERSAVSKGDRDPYDTYDKIKEIHKRFPSVRVFWLVGERGKFDRNISIADKGHRKLIRSVKKAGVTIGLHPSYASLNDGKMISREKSKLEVVLFENVRNSRQHYLRFTLPRTYRILEKVGFTDEYSMGFAEHVGFRCGTARAHKWFNLAKNKESKLTIHPFAYMDGTLREYMNLDVEESKLKIKELYNEVKRYGGDFLFIWHNETIGDYGNWKGWAEVLDHTLNLDDE